MKLNAIQKEGAWSDAAARMNTNFQKIETEVEKLNYDTRRNKGYFATSDALTTAVATAMVGDIAYVGSTSPYAIYKWNGSAWEDTGSTHTETTSLGDYYTKGEVDTIKEDLSASTTTVDSRVAENEAAVATLRDDLNATFTNLGTFDSLSAMKSRVNEVALMGGRYIGTVKGAGGEDKYATWPFILVVSQNGSYCHNTLIMAATSDALNNGDVTVIPASADGRVFTRYLNMASSDFSVESVLWTDNISLLNVMVGREDTSVSGDGSIWGRILQMDATDAEIKNMVKANGTAITAVEKKTAENATAIEDAIAGTQDNEAAIATLAKSIGGMFTNLGTFSSLTAMKGRIGEIARTEGRYIGEIYYEYTSSNIWRCPFILIISRVGTNVYHTLIINATEEDLNGDSKYVSFGSEGRVFTRVIAQTQSVDTVLWADRLKANTDAVAALQSKEIDLTQAEYDSLVSAGKVDETKTYYIIES